MISFRSLLPFLSAVLVFAPLGCGADDPEPAPVEDAGSPPIDAPAAGEARGGEDAPPKETFEVPEGCNPLAFEHDCMLPYPFDHFLVKDESLPSGKRVSYPEPALAQSADGTGISVRRMPADGFSIQPHVMAHFAVEIDAANLTAAGPELSGSIGDESPTLIIEASTGRRIQHFVDLDPRETEDPTRRAMTLRPMERLKNGARYVVALRGLVDAAGAPVAPPEGFRRLRDAAAAGVEGLAALAARFDADVFGVLEGQGVAREDLILAWDFTTQTREHATGDMLTVTGKMRNATAADPPAFSVLSVEEDVNEEIGRLVHATITVPLFLDKPGVGGVLARDDDGKPVQNGTAEVDVTVLIPRSITDGSVAMPARLVQFGHGFFGDRDEIEGSFVRGFAHQKGVVVVAINWWGMEEADRGAVADLLYNDPSEVLRFVERVHQGVANQIALTAAAKATMTAAPELLVDGTLPYDPSEIYWYGISQGHILGGTFMALTPHLERAVLGVGGAGFSHMMMRSKNFTEFLVLINAHTLVPLEQGKLLAHMATVIDRFDPLTYAPYVLAEPLPGSPSKHLLLHIGIGDAQVPNVTSHLHARALGLALLHPAARAISGLNGVNAPTTASALVEFDFGLTGVLPGDRATPPESGNEVHEGVRRTEAGKAQIDAFFHPDGVIEHHCEGPCDPE